MASISPQDGTARLAKLGVEFHETSNDEVPAELLTAVLPIGHTQVRGVVTMDPPASGEEFSGVGAWHRNAQDEAHFLRDGTGEVQFIDDAGIIKVHLAAGDVMIIRKAEHRFRAKTPATWVLHYSGTDGQDLETTPTGRTDSPWD